MFANLKPKGLGTLVYYLPPCHHHLHIRLGEGKETPAPSNSED